MERIKLPIFFTTAFLVFFGISPFIGVPDLVVISAWALSPLLVVWMVIRVLKDGKAPNLKFDDVFYEDYQAERVKERPCSKEPEL